MWRLPSGCSSRCVWPGPEVSGTLRPTAELDVTLDESARTTRIHRDVTDGHGGIALRTGLRAFARGAGARPPRRAPRHDLRCLPRRSPAHPRRRPCRLQASLPVVLFAAGAPTSALQLASERVLVVRDPIRVSPRSSVTSVSRVTGLRPPSAVGRWLQHSLQWRPRARSVAMSARTSSVGGMAGVAPRLVTDSAAGPFRRWLDRIDAVRTWPGS